MADNKSSDASARPATKPGVFDVSHPGRTPANATSRPVIVKHPVMQDPMVKDPPQPDEERVTAPALTPAKKVVIQPLHAEIKPDEPAPTPEEKPTEEPAAAPEPAPESKDEPTIDPETPVGDLAPEPNNAGVPADPKTREDDDELVLQHAARLEKMIESEEFFLPIETLEQRRSRKVAIFGVILIIVLAAAWYDVALDANLLPNTYNAPHTSFFSIK